MKYFILILMSILLISCKGDFASPEVKNSYTNVMEVHDEVMPEMSTINKLRKKIKKLEEQNSTSEQLIKQLEKADDGMMDWMQAFKLDKKAPVETQLEYLKTEQQKIDKVSLDMKTAISSAQAYLNTKK